MVFLTSRRISKVSMFIGSFAIFGLLPRIVLGEWQEHRIRRGDGRGGWITHPAGRQVLKHPESQFTLPFGLVSMDSGEIALLCSREKTESNVRKVEAIIAFSKDSGATWTEFSSIPGSSDRPMLFTDLGLGRLSCLAPRRFFSSDYGRTWPESLVNPPTREGLAFNSEGNAWVDRDGQGRAKAILELGWHYSPGKSHPKDDATVVFRRSVDGARPGSTKSRHENGSSPPSIRERSGSAESAKERSCAPPTATWSRRSAPICRPSISTARTTTVLRERQSRFRATTAKRGRRCNFSFVPAGITPTCRDCPMATWSARWSCAMTFRKATCTTAY
jgi:hypothetical protein